MKSKKFISLGLMSTMLLTQYGMYVCQAEEENKATVFGYWVNDPERYGVAEFDIDGNCLSIE